ncbi:hypothetical protein D1AOALGA4SA_6879 [Olavius algarvensis Delta 1 endosymbiont]|nr:hypothetical protein D1AOALGA4SA_6879 [Olavius algarvensis Delta 1 endosymbiont]
MLEYWSIGVLGKTITPSLSYFNTPRYNLDFQSFKILVILVIFKF